MIWLSEIAIASFNIWMAWYHSRLIKKSVKIKHGLWGVLYAVLAGGLSLWMGSWLLAAVAVFLRKVVFDTALNLFRGLAVFYVSPELERYTGLKDAIRKGKVIDWMHYKAFGLEPEIYMIIYSIVIVILNIWIAR